MPCAPEGLTDADKVMAEGETYGGRYGTKPSMPSVRGLTLSGNDGWDLLRIELPRRQWRLWSPDILRGAAATESREAEKPTPRGSMAVCARRTLPNGRLWVLLDKGGVGMSPC